MGCFNQMGFVSHLPITEGDEIVFFICADFSGLETENISFAPGTLSPIFLPIKGKYDDYGGVTDIVRDENVEYIEELFDMPFERIQQALHRNGGTSLGNMCKKEETSVDFLKVMDDDYTSMLKTLKSIVQFYTVKSENLCLMTTMEHLSVYKLISSQYEDVNFTSEYDKTVGILREMEMLTSVNIFDCHYSSSLIHGYLEKIKDMTNEVSENEAKKITDGIMRSIKIDRALSSFSRYNPCRETWFGMKGYNGLKFNWESNQEEVKEFCFFVCGLKILCICFAPSTYGNQSIMEEADTIKALYEHYLKKIEEKTQKYLEY